MKTYKNIFIDFDDTLIDTQGFATKCLTELYDEYSLTNYFDSQDQFLTTYHKHTKKLWEDYALGLVDKDTLLRERFEKPFAHVPQIIGRFTENLNRHFLEKVVEIDWLIDGALDLLEYLKEKDYKIIMLSNGFTEMQYKKINKVGFDKYFDHVILSDAVGKNKPDPIIFEEALRINHSKVEESVMIGDSYMTDIQGAINIGMDQIWYNPQKLVAEVEPTYVVSKLPDIKAIL